MQASNYVLHALPILLTHCCSVGSSLHTIVGHVSQAMRLSDVVDCVLLLLSAARIHDLESRLPTQVARLRSRMGREDRERLQYFSSAPRGSLLGRVEVLEEGMELLLAAQVGTQFMPSYVTYFLCV